MIAEVGGGSAISLLAAQMKEVAARQNVDVSVVRKIQDVEKMQGEAALKLIEGVAQGLAAGSVDIHV